MIRILDQARGADRLLVAIAGPPASGKSTLAKLVAEDLNTEPGDNIACVVPMDGFHFDNRDLELKGLLHRKGAPETFDVQGFVDLVLRLKSNQLPIKFPLFDRAGDRVLPDAGLVSPHTRIVLLEGNYILADLPCWDRLHGMFDLTVFLDVSLALVRQRLMKRWLDAGMGENVAIGRVTGNDLPNAELVLQTAFKTDVVLHS